MKPKLLIICLVFLCSLHGMAQGSLPKNLDRERAEQIPARLKEAKPELAGKVLIRNTTGTDLGYSISVDKLNWKSETVRTGYTMTYTSPGFTFTIQTIGKAALQYYLTSGYSYSLAWNKALDSWDIFVDP